MTEYNLKFKDLEEGKIYKASYGGKYRIIQGLLWSFRTGNWSDYSHSQSGQIRFKEVIQVSEGEKKLLSVIDNKYKYIAMDKDGGVWIYTYKPFKSNKVWDCDSNNQRELEEIINLNLFSVDFNFLSWEDEEPTKISDLL